MFYVVLCHCVEGWMDTREQLYIMCRLETYFRHLFRRGNDINFTSNTSTIITSPKHSKNHALASHESLCPADQLAQLRILRSYPNQPITSTSQQFMENPLGNCGFSIPEQFTTRKNQRSRVGGFRPQRPSELRTRVAALPSKPPTSSTDASRPVQFMLGSHDLDLFHQPQTRNPVEIPQVVDVRLGK